MALSAARDIAEQFTLNSGYVVRITTASTGKLYAQITNGAPFDLLLAAGVETHTMEAAPMVEPGSGVALGDRPVSGVRLESLMGEGESAFLKENSIVIMRV